MSLMTILLFIPACFALSMAPGPNNLLSMANAKRYGVRTACYAGIGRLVAFVGMITLAATGLATVFYTSEKIVSRHKGCWSGLSTLFGLPAMDSRSN